MRIWSLVSQKGGTGKSTISTQLAVVARQAGDNVCIVDLDPQGSAEVWYRIRDGEAPGAISSLPDNLHKVIEGSKTFGITTLIIDTAPHSDRSAVEAIKLSTLVLCPTLSSVFDVWALKDTVAVLDLCHARDRATVVVNGLPTQGTDAAYQEAKAAVDEMGIAICKTGIGHRKAFVSAVNAGRGVTEIAPKDKGADEIRALWSELLKFERPLQRAGKLATKARRERAR